MFSSFPDQLPSPTDSALFIVIGSGIAGLFTALELSKTGRVILITKTTLNESNTTYAQGGVAAAIGINDSPELHYQDTMMAGAGLCDSAAVLAVVYEGPQRIKQLIDFGVPFDRENGTISLAREAAHSRRRIIHAGDATGRAISQTLITKVLADKNITFYQDHFGLALVTNDSTCTGIVTACEGQFHLFLGSAILLCTGGLGQIYSKTTNPSVATGDGIALAHNAGAVLKDLEFIQFHPTALYAPPAPPFLISEAVRGEGAILLNAAGERFMPNYHPLAELAPRDIVARSIFTEIQKTNHPSVFLDLSKIGPTNIKIRFPYIHEKCLEFGLDITTTPIPVAPAAHYTMGGVASDLWGHTSLPGLYVAGEVAATGLHGANRLASNSLLEGLVFGGRVADELKRQTLALPKYDSKLNAHYPPLLTDYASSAADYAALHSLADNYLGIVRHQDGLEKAKTLLNSRLHTPQSFALDPGYFELQNMYHLTELLIKAAITRTESRGGHFRSDFPTPQNEWRKHILFQNNSMEVT